MMSRQQLSLSEIKNIELEILRRFAKCCDENNFRYYLCGGTLLGAIRHKGFIPWDDDIDVLMPRPDYIKFLEKNADTQQFNVGTIWNKSANIPFAKIFDVTTKIDQKYSNCINMEHLWIDIFPMDGLPDEDKRCIWLYKKARFYRKMLSLSEAKYGTGTTLAKKVVKSIMYPLARLIGSERWVTLLDRYAQQYEFEKCENVGGVVWGYGPQERMKKEEYIPYIEVEFEGHKFHAPKCYDKYLRNLYGDYNQLPPQNQRLNHSMVAWKVVEGELLK